MALTGNQKTGADGKEEFVIEFTNGTYEQIKEIKDFLVKEGILEENAKLEKVIEVAIAFIERLREENKKSK
ncbi:MAG: hypothetical protein HY005_03590 [Candidatus Staskawiczbacteria bacterium]|nr:hypothetical protein [Candidatus Staskawiczbacteria bacterium]